MAINLKFDGDKTVSLVKLYTCSDLENKKKSINIQAIGGFDVVFVKNDQFSESIVEQSTTHKREKNAVHKYYFVNKQLIVDDEFINKDFLEYRDVATNTMVALGARCVIKLCIDDSKVFVEKLIDFKPKYSKYDLKQDIIPKILEHFNGFLLQIINTEKIEYKNLEEQKPEIDKLLLNKFGTMVQEYGIRILQFKILQFMSPLRSLAVHAVPIETAYTRQPNHQITAKQVAPQIATSQSSTLSKDIVTMLEDRVSLLVDKSLDKIQAFLDSSMQSVVEQIESHMTQYRNNSVVGIMETKL
ncbi:MAG: SPFH domain-containing protein [Firmicutes bacterium]|nr:SPFH domain-containing protein [Bacillota bacterium]MCL1953331.1 SPFH domain-containing protein [Bacillota bacterium]